jgi:VWFA-related protein
MPQARSVVVVLALFAGGTLLLSQSPPNQPAPAQNPSRPMFRSAVNYVEVDARVLDDKGRTVHGLTQEDFELFEDNKAQKIETFGSISIPAGTTSGQRGDGEMRRNAVDPDVVSSVASRETEGRLYVILLDDRQISPHRTTQTVTLAKQFIQKNIGPRDLTAVVSTSGRLDVSQNFTANKQLLLRAVEGFIGRKMDSGTIRAITASADTDLDSEAYFDAKTALQAIESLSEWLGSVRGRSKAVIYVSEGLDYNYEDVRNKWAELVLAQQRDAIAAATRANVTIYPVDPRGLGTDETILVGDNFVDAANINGVDQPRIPVNRPSFGAPPPGVYVPTQEEVLGQAAMSRSERLRSEIERAQTALRLMAEDTGGFAIVNTNNPGKFFERIVTQSSSYYLLGYAPTNPRREGKFRNIRVRVKRPGLRVIARKGYIEAFGNKKPPVPLTALATNTSPETREVLNGTWPVGELPLTATAVAFRGQDAHSSVAVIMESPGETLALSELDGKLVGNIEVSTVVVDQSNTITTGETQKITFGLTPTTHDRFRKKGFRTLAQLRDLKPGRYQLRLSVVPGGSSLRGSLWYDLEVPDFSKDDLAMSGLLLSSLSEGQTPTGNPRKLFAGILPVPPTTVREFKADDSLNVYAEVYDNLLSPPHQVDVTVTIRAADNRIAYRSTDWASSEEMAIGKGAYPSISWIPLNELGGPGSYVLHLQAQRQLEGTQPIVRSVPFKVVP